MWNGEENDYFDSEECENTLGYVISENRTLYYHMEPGMIHAI